MLTSKKKKKGNKQIVSFILKTEKKNVTITACLMSNVIFIPNLLTFLKKIKPEG